jgi:hypothetical protein
MPNSFPFTHSTKCRGFRHRNLRRHRRHHPSPPDQVLDLNIQHAGIRGHKRLAKAARLTTPISTDPRADRASWANATTKANLSKQTAAPFTTEAAVSLEMHIPRVNRAPLPRQVTTSIHRSRFAMATAAPLKFRSVRSMVTFLADARPARASSDNRVHAAFADWLKGLRSPDIKCAFSPCAEIGKLHPADILIRFHVALFGGQTQFAYFSTPRGNRPWSSVWPVPKNIEVKNSPVKRSGPHLPWEQSGNPRQALQP